MPPRRCALAAFALPVVLLLAGCSDSAPESTPGTDGVHPAPGADPSGDGLETGPGQAQRTTFVKDGRTDAGACYAALLVGGCRFAAGDHLLELSFPGNATRVSGSAEWMARPSTYGVAVALFHLQDNGWTWVAGTPYSSAGTVSFDWNVTGLEPLALAVHSIEFVGLPALGAGGSVPTDFHLEGTLESLA